MAEKNGNGFYREKFFYIVLLLVVGSFGWATFVGWGLAQAISTTDAKAQALIKDAEVKAETLAKTNRDIATEMRKEYSARDEAIIEKMGQQFAVVTQKLTEISTDVKWIKGQK